MNFLAHIYLSGDNEFVTIGNFISDGIRGKQYKKLENYNHYLDILNYVKKRELRVNYSW